MAELAYGYLLSLQDHPFMQCIKKRLGFLLPDILALDGIEFLDLAFNVVHMGELLQHELGKLMQM